MSEILSWFNPTKWLVLAGFIASIWAAHAFDVHRHEVKARADGANSIQVKWDAEKLTQQAQSLQAERDHRAKESELQSRVDDSKRKYDDLQSKHAPALASLAATRADNSKLRNQIDNFTSGAYRPANEDSLAACRADAATAGRVLGEALQASGENAAANEVLGDSVRTLLEAWPK